MRLGTSTAEDPGEDLHRQTGEGDSERQQLRIQEKTCIGGASRRDQLIDENGRKPDELKEKSETGRIERKVGNRTNSRTVGNRTTSRTVRNRTN